MGHDITAKLEGKEIAYMRRAAHSNLNKVIYDALHACEAYGGASGVHCQIGFTERELESAEDYLITGDFTDVSRPSPNVCDAMLSSLPQATDDVTQEREFVRDCLDCLRASNEKTITISFH